MRLVEDFLYRLRAYVTCLGWVLEGLVELGFMPLARFLEDLVEDLALPSVAWAAF